MESLINMIVFAGCVHGLFLTILVITSNKKLRIKVPLAGLMSAFTIDLAHSRSILDLFFSTQILDGSRTFEPVQLLLGPFLYLFCRNLATRGSGYRRSDILHALPFIITAFMDIFILNYNKMEIMEVRELWFLKVFILAVVVQLFVYLAVCHKLFVNWEIRSKDEYAYDTSADTAWLQAVMAGLTLSYLAYIPLLIWLLHGGPVILNDVLSLIAAVFVFAIGYLALGKSIGRIDPPKESLKTQYRNSPLDRSASLKLYKRLCLLMDTDSPYKDEELSLQSLASQMNIAPYQLSQVINENSGKNFFEFVNTYRVEEVKRLILKPDKKESTLLDIAFEAGFNSKATFNKVFKQIAGMTPSMYSSTREKNNHPGSRFIG